MRKMRMQHVFWSNGMWVLAEWVMTIPGTGARLYMPIAEAPSVRMLRPPRRGRLQRIADWFRAVW